MFEQIATREITTKLRDGYFGAQRWRRACRTWRLTSRLDGMARLALEAGARHDHKRGYFVRPTPSVGDRLRAAVIEIVLIELLSAAFIIVAALIAIDVLDIR
jgi:hypothetical protein